MANQFTKTKRIKKLPLIAILGNFTRKTVDLAFLIFVSKPSIPDHTTAPSNKIFCFTPGRNSAGRFR
jgi:hypothetical protein